MEETDKDEIANKEFISTICKICGVCAREGTLLPDFCRAFYETDSSQFINNIIHNICLLKESDLEKYKRLRTFEGFCALFCRQEACPIFDRECGTTLSKRLSCYELFLRQSFTHPSLEGISRIYNIWSGIDPPLIGESFKLFSGLTHLPKKRRKQITKALRKIKRVSVGGQEEHRSRKKHSRKKNKCKRSVNTLFFYNDSIEWEEKLSSYLDETNN